MGEHNVSDGSSEAAVRGFAKQLLDDVKALERMIHENLFEEDVRRIGAEQEMVLVDHSLSPSPSAQEILQELSDDGRFTTEIARFNLEANLPPCVYGGDCLRQLEEHLFDVLETASGAAIKHGKHVLLTGILPTLKRADIGLHNMTPNPRYFELNEQLKALKGGDFHVLLKGLDEIDVTADSVMLEACNTSFQLHFQVTPAEFPNLYNIAQVVTAPVMAAASNSPLLLGRRLWHETRIALFERAVDPRSGARTSRGSRSRVSFGDDWVRDSVLEIFKEDIARFRIILTREASESPTARLNKGEIPDLGALCLHNSTVWRWNRACYGIGGGKPHLRIENRALPSGPTVIDEVANAALFFGLMTSFADQYENVAETFNFDNAKHNFLLAARYGLNAQFRWLDKKQVTARELLLGSLIPSAREGLKKHDVPAEDIDRYLGVIEARVESERTGSQWMLDSWASMPKEAKVEAKVRGLTAFMLSRCGARQPVHEWPDATLRAGASMRASHQTVGQIMTTDLFTVRPGDLVDLATSVMEWKHVRHVPVEDNEGKLAGLLAHTTLLKLLSEGENDGIKDEAVAVSEVMDPNPLVVSPDTPLRDAMRLLLNTDSGCLLVVEDDKLAGIVTQADFVQAFMNLMDELAPAPKPAEPANGS